MKLKDLLNNKAFQNSFNQMKRVCEARDVDLFFDWDGKICFEEKDITNK